MCNVILFYNRSILHAYDYQLSITVESFNYSLKKFQNRKKIIRGRIGIKKFSKIYYDDID